jgi:hypothetical protein
MPRSGGVFLQVKEISASPFLSAPSILAKTEVEHEHEGHQFGGDYTQDKTAQEFYDHLIAHFMLNGIPHKGLIVTDDGERFHVLSNGITEQVLEEAVQHLMKPHAMTLNKLAQELSNLDAASATSDQLQFLGVKLGELSEFLDQWSQHGLPHAVVSKERARKF